MNKRLLTLFGTLVLSLGLASCGGKSSGDTTGDTNTTGTSEVDKTPYTAAVSYPNGSHYDQDGLFVLWCTSRNCLMPVEVNKDTGVATANYKENNYYVHLDGLPEQYTYDPNIYNVTPTEKHCNIQLHDRYVADLENGESSNSLQNRYMLTENNFYKVETKSNTDEVFFGFRPTELGVYTIESFEQILLNSDEENPSINYYGSDPDLVPSDPIRSDDNSKDGVNFKLEINVTDAESSLFTFGIKSTSFMGTSSFDIRIMRTSGAL